MQGDADFILFPGALALVDAAYPLRLNYDGKNCHVALHVPHVLLNSRLTDSRARPTLLRGTSSQLIGSLTHSALGSLGDIGEQCGQMLQESFLALLSAAVGKTYGASTAGSGPRNYFSSLYKIRNFISNQLQTELSAKTVAQAQGISVRQLYRMVENSGTSLAAVIRVARLERCAFELRDPVSRNQTITSIAFKWGFNDSAHFARVFKDEFGQSPREYRLKAKSSITAQSCPSLLRSAANVIN